MSACKVADDFPPESWLQIRVLPGEVPPVVRVRHLLKRMLRDYGIRVVRVAGVPPEAVSDGAVEIRGNEAN